MKHHVLLSLFALVLLGGCERPPMQTTQQGFRGTAMQQTDNPRLLAARRAAQPVVPADAPEVGDAGPRARDVFQNVKVLGHLSVAEFTRHMNAITQWVSPQQGCAYCHNLQNLADDSLYTKVVSRRMIEMTQHLNADWKPHVGETGVTCYTCHRGNNVPQQVWFSAKVPKANTQPMMGNDFGQNKAVPSIGVTSLPYDPYTAFLQRDEPIRVNATQALPHRASAGKPGATIQQTEKSYALMIHMSESLGVNCTFCHNSQSFMQWTPKRVTAWHGIRMERDLNNNYLTPLTDQFPASRRGPNGDVAKAYCATCHQGASKPLGGLQMAKLYSGLKGLTPVAAAVQPPQPTETHVASEDASARRVEVKVR